jgi:putative endonuclease
MNLSAKSKQKQHKRRRRAYLKGRMAETVATFMLRLKGYKILARGYRRPVGEIDIIALHRGVLVAVEVKKRPSLEKALHAVGTIQQRRIKRTMEAYLGQNPQYQSCDLRFDLIHVPSFFHWPNHMENAW